MRNFSDNVKECLASQVVAIFYCVRIDVPNRTINGISYPSTPILDTTAHTNILMGDGLTYLSTNGISNIEPPRLSSSLDREPYKITYIDPEFEKRDMFEAGLTGAPVSVRVGFFNPKNITFGGALPGAPLTNLDDTIIAYQGVVDTQSYAIDPNSGTVAAVIECSSPMASLSMSKPLFTSKEALRAIYPNDSSFDMSTHGARKLAFLWGKA